MENSRYQKGREKLAQIDGQAGDRVIDSLQDIAPELGRYIIEFAFGDIYSRDGLTLPEREMVTLASLLTAGGCEAQLEVHIHGALNVGLSPEQVIEAFIHCVPYTGFPKVLNAVTVARRVFAGRAAEKAQ